MTEANPDPVERKREYNRRYREANRERLRQQKHERYVANREQVLEKVKQYQEANRSAIADRKRAARAADPEKRRQQNRDYRQANLEKLREKDRRYYETNGEEIRAKAAKYYLATRGQQREYRLNWAHGIDAATWAANGFDRLHVEVEARQQAADEAARLEGPLSSAEVSKPPPSRRPGRDRW